MLAWALPVVLAAAWVLRGWWRPGRTTGTSDLDRRDWPVGHPSIVQLAAHPVRMGWTGIVVDAHTAAPVPGARIQCVQPTFTDQEVLWEATADADGRFTAPAPRAKLSEHALLSVSSRLHARLERPLPPAGDLRIALMLRRRALLQGLLHWAGWKGLNAPQSREPTPHELARAAARRGRPEVADWASAVADAVFGAQDVDEAMEQRLDELARCAAPAASPISGGRPSEAGPDS